MRALFSVGSGRPKLQEIMWLGQITHYQRAVLLVSQARSRLTNSSKVQRLQYSPAALVRDSQAIIALADHEGLWSHAQSVRLRCNW